MNKKQYEARRNALLNEAQELINANKALEAEAKMQEVTNLDELWEATAKAQANLNALRGAQHSANVEAMLGAENGEQINLEDDQKIDPENAYATELYATAWAKKMLGRKLNNKEAKIYDMVQAGVLVNVGEGDAFTHTTENTPSVIPQQVSNGIWKEIGEMHPYYEDVMKTYVPGGIKIIVAQDSSKAAWYVESVQTKDGKELFTDFTLNGCELARNIKVSWKLKAMAIEDFIPYIITQMAEQMGSGMSYGTIRGKGVVQGEAPEPLGVITGLENEKKKEGGADQIVEYDGELKFEDLTAARGKIKSGYKPVVYANSETIWNNLAHVKDGDGHRMMIPDGSGNYRILGCQVKEEDGLEAGEILFSDAKKGYHLNVNKTASIMTSENTEKRETTYCGYAVADGAPKTMKAHALVRKKAAVAPEEGNS